MGNPEIKRELCSYDTWFHITHMCNVMNLISMSNQLEKVTSRLHTIAKRFHRSNERSLICNKPLSPFQPIDRHATLRSQKWIYIMRNYAMKVWYTSNLLTYGHTTPKPWLVAQMNHRLEMPGNPKKGSTFCSGGSMVSTLHFVFLKSK